MNSLTVTLPLPPKALSPNARCHFMAKANAAKKYRATSKYLAIAQGVRERWERASVSIVWRTKINRRRDADNCLASLKNGLDGLRDADVIADDSGLSFEPIRFEKGEPGVVLTVTKGEA